MAAAVAVLSPVSMTTSTPCALSRATAAREVGRNWSATPSRPSKVSPCDTPTTLLPAPASGASKACGIATPCSARKPGEPSAWSLPSSVASRPLPGTARRLAGWDSAMSCFFACDTMASASGWLAPCSRLAATRSSRSALMPSAGSTSVTTGLPCVSVPVLSTASTSTFFASSSASAFFTRMPAAAPRPVPTMIAVGVARPSAQGQAITSTATALTKAWVKSPAKIHQPAKARRAMAVTTGTKIAEMRSARRCTGALEPCACSTMRMMPASSVWLPTPVARQLSRPSPFTVAAYTLPPTSLATGRLSPVSMASFTLEAPSTTSPSTGTLSPGRTTKTSPGFRLSTATSTSTPSRSTRAVCGCRRISASIAAEVLALARASSSLPISTRVMTAAEASK